MRACSGNEGNECNCLSFAPTYSRPSVAIGLAVFGHFITQFVNGIMPSNSAWKMICVRFV